MFQDENLPLPSASRGTSSASVSLSDKVANIQFNNTPTGMEITIPTAGNARYISDSTTSETKFNKKEGSTKVTANDDTITVNTTGKYYHNINITFTIDGTTPSTIRTVLAQIVKGDGSFYGDDTSYGVIETNGSANRYETLIIKTFIDHVAGDVAKIQFTTSESADKIIIKQIRWIIM